MVMSVEQINVMQAMALVPTLKLFGMMLLVVVGVWFGTVAVCAVVEKVKNEIKIKGAR